jgi:hypothetical protein
VNGWYVLGFTADAVVGAWQHERLARACVNVWNTCGRPTDWRIAEAPAADGGDGGEYVLHWYVNHAAALALDVADVSWRPFVVGMGGEPPSGARDLLDPAIASVH